MELRVVNPKALAFNPNNPRQIKAAPEMDAQLTANIKAVGVISPPLVRETADGLEIIAGERRVRCAIAAGVTELHVLISQAEDGSDPIRALAENTQRSPMNPVDQWRAFEALFAAGWNEEAVCAAFSIGRRPMQKLRLLASIHPKMLDRMAHELPREDELRTIAAAPLDEQASVWKRLKPKRGEEISWWPIASALRKRRAPARDAAFDDDTAIAFGIVWEDDLFGPADQDNRFTTDFEAFVNAQTHWLETVLAAQGVVLETDDYGPPRLPKGVVRRYGEPEEGDVAFYLDCRDGKIHTIPIEHREPSKDVSRNASITAACQETPSGRPDISQKGRDQIGEYRTGALRQAVLAGEYETETLIALLVLALGADNISVRGSSYCSSRRAFVDRLVDGGVLTRDPAAIRTTARDMIAEVLNCQTNGNGSGMVGRIAGEAIDADRYLPNMADDAFLKMLSKPGIERTAREAGVAVMPHTGKEIRAALIRHVGDTRYVLPEARFAMSKAEKEEQAARSEACGALYDDLPSGGVDEEGFEDEAVADAEADSFGISDADDPDTEDEDQVAEAA